eukprot:2539891-Amphidinium_carterae.2
MRELQPTTNQSIEGCPKTTERDLQRQPSVSLLGRIYRGTQQLSTLRFSSMRLRSRTTSLQSPNPQFINLKQSMAVPSGRTNDP